MSNNLRSHTLWIALLLGLFAILYGPYLTQGGLLLDDLGFIHPELTHHSYLQYQKELSAFITMTARPISALLHGIAYWNFGSRAMLFHSVNLGLFFASIIIFFLAVQKIYSSKLAVLTAIFALLYPYSPATSFASIMMNSNLSALFWSLALYLSTRNFVAKPLVLGLLLLCSALAYESFIPLFLLVSCSQIIMQRFSLKPIYWRANLTGTLLAFALYGIYKAYVEQWLFQAQFTRVHAYNPSQLLERTVVIAQHAYKVMFVDAIPITNKALHNIYILDWVSIGLVVAITLFAVFALWTLRTKRSFRLADTHQLQPHLPQISSPQQKTLSAKDISLDWRDGLFAVIFFFAAHTIFWFSTYLPDAQDAFATRTLGGVRFAWSWLIAMLFFKLLEVTRRKVIQAAVWLGLIMFVTWCSITIIGQRQAWISAARLNQIVVNQFMDAMKAQGYATNGLMNVLVVMPNRFEQEVNVEPIFSTTWDITPSLKERIIDRPVLAQAIYVRDLARLSIQNNLVDYEGTWRAPANNLYLFDATQIESGKSTLAHITNTDALKSFFITKGLLLDAANYSLITPGATIVFNRQIKKADHILEAGWGHLEDWGVWSIEPQVQLKLPIFTNQPSTYEFEVRAFVNPKHPEQRVDIWVRGQLQNTVTLRNYEHNRFSVQLPAASPQPSNIAHPSMVVIFKLPDAISPKALEMGSDDRMLGIGLEKINVVPSSQLLRQ